MHHRDNNVKQLACVGSQHGTARRMCCGIVGTMRADSLLCNLLEYGSSGQSSEQPEPLSQDVEAHSLRGNQGMQVTLRTYSPHDPI
jgi:hypothetical protein